MDFEVSPITLSPEYLNRREYYTGPATAMREFIHNSKHKGAKLNAARQWTDLTTRKVGKEQWTCLSFLDDGCSMDRAELRQAVKFDPPSDQATCTTSRFGEGMKAAAFWLSTARSAIFLFALKGTERTVVLLGGNNERDLDRCSLIIAPEIRQQDGADEMLACAPKDRKSGLRDIIDRLCRIPTPKGCAGNEGSPYNNVQDILQVFTDMQEQTRTDHAFRVEIWNPRDRDSGNAGGSLAAVYLDSPKGLSEAATEPCEEDRKPALQPRTPGRHSQPRAGPQRTIMLRDKDGKVSDLSSVCQRLFLPESDQDICGAAFYATRGRTVPRPRQMQAMQMHVCGQPVGSAGNPWSQVLQAGGKPSTRLPIGDGQGCMQLVSLPAHAYGKPGQARMPDSGIIFVGAGSDHTLNMEPIMPDLHARYTNLLPLVVMGARSGSHYDNVWRGLCELCGGVQEVTTIISEATFMKACRPCKEGGSQNMRFLRAICLQPYLALVQATSHASLQYDPSKTDIRTSPAFAQALMRTILKFAIDNHLPEQARPPADKESEKEIAAPASPSPVAPKQTTKKRAAPTQNNAEEAGPSGTEAGASRRKSARQVAAPKIFSPDMSGTFKRAKSSHSSDSQAVLEARDKFCKQADTLLSQMKTTSSPATIAQLITKIRQGVSTLSRAL